MTELKGNHYGLTEAMDATAKLQQSYTTIYIEREMLKQAFEAMIRSITLEGKFEPNEMDLVVINRVKKVLVKEGIDVHSKSV